MAPTEDFHDFQDPNAASVDRLVQALDRAYHSPWILMWRWFLSGLMYALGATLGFALLIIIAGYVLQALGGINLLNPLTNKFEDLIAGAANKTTSQGSNLTAQQQAALTQILQQASSPTPTAK